LGVPTSSISKENQYYHKIELKVKSTNALLSQIRTIDAKRLKYKMTKLPDGDLKILKRKLSKIILGE
jgi:mRNA-degrading endonuclease toxin of MazEF toxin-antitoxin module